MNIAPYLIARLNDWSLPPTSLIERGFIAVEENIQYLELPLRAFGLTSVTELFGEFEGKPLPVGLYAVPLSVWDSALSALTMASRPKGFQIELSKRPTRFVRGVVVDSIESVLLFPDDAHRELNFSLFAPTKNESQDLVLHTISVSVGSDEETAAWKVLSEDSRCTLSVSGTFPDRRFACSRTGCDRNCQHGRRIEGNSVTTIYCEC